MLKFMRHFQFCRHINISNENKFPSYQVKPAIYVAFIDLHILAWFHHDAVAEIFFSLIHNMYK